MELSGKVVVITGASSGIGRAAAHEFARHGARLVLAARNAQALDEAVEECTELGAEAVAYPADVGDWHAVERVAETALAKFGTIDVWVNDAAVSTYGRLEDVPMPEFEQVVRTNLLGTVHGCRSALRTMRPRGHGVVINIASMVGVVGQPFASAYAATKWAVRGLSVGLRQENEDKPGIHVCTVLPGTVDTPFFQHAANHAHRPVKAMPPVHTPEEAARTIVDVARHPRREAFVGMEGRMASFVHALAPGLSERIFARHVNRHHFGDSPQEDTPGNLFAAGTDTLRGGWGGRPAAPPRWGLLAVAAAVAVPLAFVTWRQARGRDGVKYV